MARIRTVKPEYPKSRKVRSVSRDARLLNIHLWNLADDEGRLQEIPRWILGEVFPTDEDVTETTLGILLAELEGARLIVRYEVGGQRYIYCHDFEDHQTISHPKDSILPGPPAGEPSSNGTGTPPEASGRPTVRKGTGNREQGTGKAEFDDWLEHYRTITGRTSVRGSKQARREFNARRSDGRSLADLKLATVGCHSDGYCRTHGHDVPETILRDSKVDRYVALGREAASKRDGLAELAQRETA